MTHHPPRRKIASRSGGIRHLTWTVELEIAVCGTAIEAVEVGSIFLACMVLIVLKFDHWPHGVPLSQCPKIQSLSFSQ